MKFLVIIFLLSMELTAIPQIDTISQHGFRIPRSLTECIKELDNTFTQNAKNKLLSLKKDTIQYIYDVFIIDEWLHSDSSRLKYYFRTKGLGYDYQMEYFILLAYHKYLDTGNPDVSHELQKYFNFQDSLSEITRRKCLINYQKDSLDGIYIPKDLNECFKYLSLLLPDSIKQSIKASNTFFDLFKYHFTIGLWIINNWGLWNCSILKKYFNDNGIRHPDDMSGIILEGYRYYLNDSILSVQQLMIKIPPPPHPSVGSEKVKYKYPRPYQRKINQFIRTKRINDFEIGEYSSIVLK